MRRHRIEPARLMFGLALLGTVGIHLLDMDGKLELPLPALLLVAPAALLCGAVAALMTRHARQARHTAVGPDETRHTAGTPDEARHPDGDGRETPDGPPAH